jgi:hypothetical protein
VFVARDGRVSHVDISNGHPFLSESPQERVLNGKLDSQPVKERVFELEREFTLPMEKPIQSNDVPEPLHIGIAGEPADANPSESQKKGR